MKTELNLIKGTGKGVLYRESQLDLNPGFIKIRQWKEERGRREKQREINKSLRARYYATSCIMSPVTILIVPCEMDKLGNRAGKSV